MEIEISFFDVKSRYGLPARYTLRKHKKASSSLVVCLPGQAYTMDAPLMWYSSLAALESGHDVLGVEYSFQVRGNVSRPADIETVGNEISDGLKAFLKEHVYKEVILIAKSIGTEIAPLVSEGAGIKLKGAVFLTPLQTAIDFINETDRALVIVGDNDPAFSSDDMGRIEKQEKVYVLKGGNHILETPGNVISSIDMLRKMASECKIFFTSLKQ